jgi:hypothetical protein
MAMAEKASREEGSMAKGNSSQEELVAKLKEGDDGDLLIK